MINKIKPISLINKHKLELGNCVNTIEPCGDKTKVFMPDVRGMQRMVQLC